MHGLTASLNDVSSRGSSFGEIMKIIVVAGTRPNFVKIAPIMRAIEAYNATQRVLFQPFLIHTGQHYDLEMSDIFFKHLHIPKPDANLGVGSGLHGAQTAAILVAVEKTLLEQRPDLVLVVGDVNSTAAAALAAAKLCIPVAHVEAGLRSFDRTMPEEINRIVTDVLSTWLFTTDRIADGNLLREGVSQDKIHRVGNVMIDTLMACMPAIDASPCLAELKIQPSQYAVATIHRAGNVDDPVIFGKILEALEGVALRTPIVFPCHPRTRARLETFGLKAKGLRVIEPLGYVDFMALVKRAAFVVSDSGGIQAETTVLGVPCITMRDTTEFPLTVEKGTNVLVGCDSARIREEAFRALKTRSASAGIPEFWDGHAAERIVGILARHVSG